MNTKHLVVISGIIGGIIGSVSMTLLDSPVTAQKDKFDTIQCRRLEVVDAAGKHSVIIESTEHGGGVIAYGKDGKLGASLSIGSFAGFSRLGVDLAMRPRC